MGYAWIITQDHIADVLPDAPSDVGVSGPRAATPTQLAALRLGVGHPFRMLDDDGEVYYEGLFLGNSDACAAFGPLDDFGTPNAGCTSIEYLRDGRWEVL